MAHSLYASPQQERRCRHIMTTTERSMREILREALQVGLLVLLAGSPTDEEGQYADLTADDLAARLQVPALHIVELLNRQGRTPSLLTQFPAPLHTIASVSSSPQEPLPGSPSPVPRRNGTTNGTHSPARPHEEEDGLLAELLEAGCVLVED